MKKKKIKIKIKTKDNVKILSGNFKNKTGKVIKIITKKYRAIIKNINIVNKYIKPSSKNPKGKIKKIESSIHISNLKIIK